jgi:8-oxo-dGTP diphosphatase
MMDPVCNSGKAIVIPDEFLLVIVHRDEEGDWFSLPGGGQEPGETLTDALQRECLEELGVGVVVGPLRLIREYIGANHEFRDEDADIHQIDFMFECGLSGDLPDAPPSNPDATQTGIRWLPLTSLPTRGCFRRSFAATLRAGSIPVPLSAWVMSTDGRRGCLAKCHARQPAAQYGRLRVPRTAGSQRVVDIVAVSTCERTK